MIELRAYRTTDADATLEVFLAAVRGTAAAHYSPEQIAAWAGEPRDLDVWNERRGTSGTIVAVLDDTVVGFIDLQRPAVGSGHIDMLFVHPEAGRRGVASRLYGVVLARALAAGIRSLTVDASLSARPFFETVGFTVVEQGSPVIAGVTLTNFRMALDLDLTRDVDAPGRAAKNRRMTDQRLTITVEPWLLSVYRTHEESAVALERMERAHFSSITRFGDLLWVTTDAGLDLGDVAEHRCRMLRIEHASDLPRELARILTVLADAGVGVIPMSSYGGDQLLVKDADLDAVTAALDHLDCELVLPAALV